MNPIVSEYDHRLVTLIGIVVDIIGEQALMTGASPEELLALSLYRVSKEIFTSGEEQYIDRLHTCFPALREALS
jgi:hypothetical protein